LCIALGGDSSPRQLGTMESGVLGGGCATTGGCVEIEVLNQRKCALRPTKGGGERGNGGFGGCCLLWEEAALERERQISEQHAGRRRFLTLKKKMEKI